MRKLSLQTYSLYEMKKIDFDHSMRIIDMILDAEEDNVRLQAPLATWLYLDGRWDIETKHKMRLILNDMHNKYPNVSEENALKYLKECDNIELNKFYQSFVSENKRRDENEFKDRMRELIKSIKSKKNISNYKICKLAGVDMGNFHSYYVLNKNNKLSKEKIKTIVKVCNQFV